MKYTPEIHKQITVLLRRSATPAVVQDFAGMILEDVFAEEYDNGGQLQLTEQNALNGAKSWSEASWGGSYLCYNSDLEEVFPGVDTEKLLDAQAAALAEAWEAIEDAVLFIAEAEKYGAAICSTTSLASSWWY